MIIVFSGVDCAGKSTQIEILKKEFLSQGVTAQSLWSRGGYTPGFELIKKFLRIIIGKKMIPVGRSKEKQKAMSNSFIRYLWLTIAMLDLIFLYAIIIRIKSFLGKVIICDRYLGDTYIDFSLNFPKSNFNKMWLWKLLTATLPKPDFCFLFTLSVENSIYRSNLKNEPFPDSKEVLQQRLDMYKLSALLNDDNWVKINGDDTIVFSADIIKKKIFPMLKANYAS